MINVTNVGHVVLKVTDLERSVRFYRDMLGLKEVARATFDRPMAFFSATGENHPTLASSRSAPTQRLLRRITSGFTTSRFGIGHSLEALRGGGSAHRGERGPGASPAGPHRQPIHLPQRPRRKRARLELYVDAGPRHLARRPCRGGDVGAARTLKTP